MRLHLVEMFEYLRANMERDWEKMIACPTMSPEPYNKVIRATAAPMTGRWAESEEDWARTTLPDFCVGWLTVISPSLGAQLAQVAHSLYKEAPGDNFHTSDSLITGVLRERLPHVRIERMEIRHPVWNTVALLCPVTNLFKHTFFNDFVLSKRSSTTHYVGSISDPKVWRFFICFTLEGALRALESMSPSLVPQIIWNICSR